MAPSLVGKKGEQLVFLDGRAGGDAPDILPGEVRSVVDGVRGGVEGWIAPKVIGCAVQLVSARLHLQRQHAAGAVSKLGVDAVLLDVDFLHRVHGRRVAILLGRHRR